MGKSPGDDRATLYLRGVPRNLVREAKALAARRGITLTALVVEALAREVEPRAGPRAGGVPRELRADAAWYEAHRRELLRRYRGQYLAIREGKVIDHDRDFAALARRVFEHLGPHPVYMPKCVPERRIVRAPSPRVARG